MGDEVIHVMFKTYYFVIARNKEAIPLPSITDDYVNLKYRSDPARALIGQKPMFYQSIKHRKSVFYCFANANEEA